MPTHQTSAYRDGHKWIVYCIKCGQEEPIGECSERYLMPQYQGGTISSHLKYLLDKDKKPSYVSGIAKPAF